MTDLAKPKSDNRWYKNYMVLVFVIGLPVFVVIVCIFFIFYAIKHQDSTVRDDWYMDGKALYQDASKDKLAYDIGIAGIMRFLDTGGQVVFELNYPAQSVQSGVLRDGTTLTYPKTLSVVISHATDKDKDRDFILTHTQGNIYTGTVNLDTHIPAKYYLQVTPNDSPQWRLIHSQKLPAKTVGFVPLAAFDQRQNPSQ